MRPIPLVLLCLAATAPWTTASTAAAPPLPNILLILADDLGYGDLGCYGATKVQTPHIDSLAREGRMFTDAHSASAVCTPSRYDLLTGRHAWRSDHWRPIFHRVGLIVDPHQMTLGRLLQQRGYATGCIGKWHLGFGDPAPDWNGELKPGPLEVGFDNYFGVPVVNSHPPFVFVEDHRVVGLDPADPLLFDRAARGHIHTQRFPEKRNVDQVGGAKAAHELYRDQHVGTDLTQRAVQWIERQQQRQPSQPFFLYFAPTNIHHPFTPHPRFEGTSQCGRYGDFIHELDWMVGRLMQALADSGLADDTLVIFTSDNGAMLNEGGQDAWRAGHRMNGDWLGFKFGAWEGGHRVPFIARWPGKIPAGSCSDQLISTIDMLATFAAITDQSLAADAGPDSINILPALTGDPEVTVRDSLVLAPLDRRNVAFRSGRWVYISAPGDGGFGGIRGGPGSVAFTERTNSDITDDGKIKPGAPDAQLYDLRSDPQQTVNVIDQHPQVAERLAAQLAQRMRDE